MLTCRDASRLVSEQLEHPLGWRKRLGLRLHLMMCVSCRRFERQAAWIRRGLHKLASDGIANDSSDLTPEGRERIRKALAEHDHRDH